MCSTPSGIPADHHRVIDREFGGDTGCSTPSGIPADHHRRRRWRARPRRSVLNAFRHPRRSPQRAASVGRWLADVLNAFRHPRRSPPSSAPPGGCSRPSAQRLPASPPITTGVPPPTRARGLVLNAFRHPRRSPHVIADGQRVDVRTVLNAFRHPRRSPLGVARDLGGGLAVLNAFRHPRRSPPHGSATRARPSAGAQRLPASPPITTTPPRPRTTRCRSAQRLPASPPITTSARRSRWIVRCECSTPSGIPADHHVPGCVE